MGHGGYVAAAWDSYSTSTRSRSIDEIYATGRLVEAFDPKKIKLRESRDSTENPTSRAVAIALDVSGSMSGVLDAIAKGLGTFATKLYEEKPIANPHLMFMGVDDVEAGDPVPFQATQFEADIRIAEQAFTQIYFEKRGGGNDHESYLLPLWFLAMSSSIDCFEKRGQKGFLFTIGDECPMMTLKSEHINKVFGDKSQKDYTAQELIDLIDQKYHYYHFMIEQGDNYRSNGARVSKAWTDLLGHTRFILRITPKSLKRCWRSSKNTRMKLALSN